MSKEQANDRKILAELASGMMSLPDRLDLVGAGRLPPQAARETALRSIGHTLRELRANKTLHDFCVFISVQGGISEFLFKLTQQLRELGVGVGRRR